MVSLESSKLFHELSAAELASLKKVTQELDFAVGQVIFHEGEPGNGIYIIKDGVVRISANVGSGQPRILTRLGPGDLFGEMAVLDNDPRSATAVAQEPTTAYFIARDDLIRMIERTPRLATGLVREVTRRLRDFNRQYIREVLESERLALVGRFASSIVHDLKNPLSIIGLSAHVSVLPGATPESRVACSVRIRKQVDRISSMVNELLEFARGTRTTEVLAWMDYAVFIEQLMEDLQPEAAAQSVTLKLETPPPSIMLRIDPSRLARVFHNFVRNAAEVMSSGGAIKLRFNLSGPELITEVHDTGSGIAPEIADRLFQPFATYGKPSGTGLGLSICKKIVEDHHGRIFARNAPEGGAIFGFALPVTADGA